MDEFFNAIIEAAMKQGLRQQSNVKSEAKTADMAQLMKEGAKRAAESAKELYDAYIKAGFVPEQAFQLVKIKLANKKG